MENLLTKLNQILTIKNQIKQALTNLGAITSTTTFEQYASKINDLYVK